MPEPRPVDPIPEGRHSQAKKLLAWVPVVFTLLAVTTLVAWHHHTHVAGTGEAHSTAGIAPLLERADEASGPSLTPADWFTRQRAYPYETIPEAERLRAFADAKTFASLATHPRGAAAWQEAGPINIGGRITDIALSEAMPSRIFLGAADGGVFRSTDEGASWTPVFDEQTSLSIGDIAVNPIDPDVVYVGTGEPNAAGDTYAGTGMYRSTDGGDTWQSIGLEASGKIGRVVIDPTNPQRLFVAAVGRLFSTNPERGLYRSTNGGASWERVLFVNDSTGVVDVVINPENPDQLFAAAWERIRRPYDRRVGGFGSGIYTSNDGGDTWSLLGTAEGLPGPSSIRGRIGLSICTSAPEVVYAIFANHPGNFEGVYRTSNGGTSWSRVDNGSINGMYSGFGWYFGQIRVSPSDPDRVFALGVGLYRSTNGGVSWSSVGNGVHVDHHGLTFDPTNTSRVLLGNDGGFYRSASGGGSGSWTKSFTLPVTQFYAITVDALQPWRIYGGTQDNSTMRTLTGALDDWDIIYGGDGFYTLVDYTNSDVIYAEYQYGGLAKSTNGGASFNGATSGISGSDRRNWSTPVVMDPVDHNTLYYGTYRVYRTTNGASFWNAISGDLTNGPSPGSLIFGTVTTIDVAPTDTDRVLAGTDDGNVWITTNGGGSWQNVSAALPDRWVTRVTFDPSNEDVAYVTLSGYRLDEYLPHVWRTDDAGATWANISSNLPGIPLNDVVIDPAAPSHLFVASDAGVYWSANTGASWAPLGTGFPAVSVHDLHLDHGSRTLVAGTHGRSAYKLSLDDLVAVVDTPPAYQPLVAVAPNPTSGAATFEVDVVVEGRITVELFDARGRMVRRVEDGYRDAGVHRFAWDGRDREGREAASGVYFYRVRTGAGNVVGRVVVRR